VVTGTATAPTAIPLEGPWEVTLAPTLDNRFGDYRLPAFPGTIGAEARRLRWHDEDGAGFAAPEVDDRAWPVTTVGFGQRFWRLGPVPSTVDGAALAQRLAGLASIDPTVPVEVGGRSLTWAPVAFSWREGIEGDPGHQGWHGLKMQVTDDFLGLGKAAVMRPHPVYKSGLPTYVAEEGAPGGYVLWTTVQREQAGAVRILTGDPAPTHLRIAGQAVTGSTAPMPAGRSTVVAWYAGAGRTHLVLQDAAAPSEPGARTPLAMRWFDLPGVLPLDPRPERAGRATWFRFQGPPGLTALTVAAHGTVEAWVGGRPCTVEALEGGDLEGAARWRVTVPAPAGLPEAVALRVVPRRGVHAGGLLPAPILLTTGPGRLAAGDWSRIDGLASYSGALWYRRTVTLTPDQVRGRLTLDLGDVAASARVLVNGREVGTLVAPPWTLEVTAHLIAGDNRVEVEVCNTLANHYQTIPTNYRGDPRSGLLGPVVLRREESVILRP